MKAIRGHHLFCMTLFSGHGYDEVFCKNMTELITEFQNGESFCLCIGPDAVCQACPNRQAGGNCALGTEDVSNRDRAALAALRLQEGDELDWIQLRARLQTLTSAGFAATCGGCRWAQEGLCSYSLLKGQLEILEQ